MWDIVEPKREYIHNWHIDAICEHLQAVTNFEIENLVISMPPRHMKSMIVSVFWQTWAWITKPETRWIFASYAANLSVRDAVKSRRLMSHPRYLDMFKPKWKFSEDENVKSRYSNNKLGYRVTTSVGGSGTGEGGDCFPKGVVVSTISGYKDISEIGVGDVVKSFNHETGTINFSRVQAIRCKRVRALVEVSTASGNKVICTPEHRIFTEEYGYRQAETIKGSRLVVEIRDAENSQSHGGSEMLHVWENIRKTQIRVNKINKTRFNEGLLLLKKLLSKASQFQKLSKVSDLWGFSTVERNEKGSKILLEEMSSKIFKTTRKNLSNLSCKISNEVIENYLLFKDLCKQRSFKTDDWEWKSMAQKWTITDSYIPKDKATNNRERQKYLCSLFNQREYHSTSHKRDSIGQSTTEFNNTLQSLSYKAPQITNDFVSVVSKVCEGDYEVYDIQVEKNHNFFANGILVHNCIVVDDPIKASDAQSETIRNSVNTWWNEEMSNRANDPKKVGRVIVMQRLHENDLAGMCLESGDYEELKLPAEYEGSTKVTSIGWSDPRTEEKELLWPERFDRDWLEKEKKKLGSYAAASQLQQSPVPKGGGLFKRKWWKYYTELPKQRSRRVQFWDCAQKPGLTNDFSVCSTWDETPNGFYLVNVFREKLETPDLERAAVAEFLKYRPNAVVIEDKSAGSALIQYLERKKELKMPIIKFDPGSRDKQTRASAATPTVESGNCYVPANASWLNDFLSEHEKFPNDTHDDQVDTTSMMVEYFNSRIEYNPRARSL